VNALSAISGAGPQQALVVGRVADLVTGRGVAGAVLTLAYDPTGAGSFAGLPARLGGRDDGWFVFHLAPTVLRLAGAAPVLRVSAIASGYTGASGEVAVSPADLALEVDNVVLAGQPAALERLHGAPFRIDIDLAPLPVALEGFVFQGGDPDNPIAGAQVAAFAPAGQSTNTAVDGAFRIAALPVAAQVTIRVTAGGVDTDFPVRPDFSQRTNRAVFATT
jgi:hypothetical protein